MMGKALDDLTLVQVGWWDVAPSTLQGPGASLDSLVAGRNVVLANEHAERVWERLLVTPGWRLLAEDDRGLERAVFAAPDESKPGTWLLVVLNNRGDEWRFSRPMASQAVRPGRAARRQNLALVWPEREFYCAAGESPDLTVSLVNRGSDDWTVGDDELFVVAWLRDSISGDVLPSEKWEAHGRAGRFQDTLRPGSEVQLPVRLLTLRVDELPLGEYTIEAILSSLNLHSEPGRLVIR